MKIETLLIGVVLVAGCLLGLGAFLSELVMYNAGEGSSSVNLSSELPHFSTAAEELRNESEGFMTQTSGEGGIWDDATFYWNTLWRAVGFLKKSVDILTGDMLSDVEDILGLPEWVFALVTTILFILIMFLIFNWVFNR